MIKRYGQNTASRRICFMTKVHTGTNRRAYNLTRMRPPPSASSNQSGSYHTKAHMIYMNTTRPGVRSRGALGASEACLSTPAGRSTCSLVDVILIFDGCKIPPYRRSFGCTKCPRLPLASLGLVPSASLVSDGELLTLSL